MFLPGLPVLRGNMAHQPSRILSVRHAMKDHNLDLLYVRSLSNIAWVTGFDNVFDTEQAHALLVSSSDICIHSDSRYSEALRREACNTEIVVDDSKRTHAAVLREYVQKVSTSKSPLRIGIEDTLSLAEFHVLEKALADADDGLSFELVELSSFVETLREVKDSTELECMKKAQAITDRAFERIVGFMKEGMTERQVQLQLDSYMFEEGAQGLAFDTIVATGAHASSPHAIPGDTVLRAGDAVVMDFGAKFGGYCSDMTRTVFIGQPSSKLQHAWETLQKVNETCEQAIQSGVEACEVHQLAENLLAKAGYKDKMGHSLGHSLGLDIHENPALSPSNKKPLCAGNVVTVEPGIYIPGQFGMRLEDFGVVTSQGFDVFTKSSHKMFIIEKLN